MFASNCWPSLTSSSRSALIARARRFVLVDAGAAEVAQRLLDVVPGRGVGARHVQARQRVVDVGRSSDSSVAALSTSLSQSRRRVAHRLVGVHVAREAGARRRVGEEPDRACRSDRARRPSRRRPRSGTAPLTRAPARCPRGRSRETPAASPSAASTRRPRTFARQRAMAAGRLSQQARKCVNAT